MGDVPSFRNGLSGVYFTNLVSVYWDDDGVSVGDTSPFPTTLQAQDHRVDWRGVSRPLGETTVEVLDPRSTLSEEGTPSVEDKSYPGRRPRIVEGSGGES